MIISFIIINIRVKENNPENEVWTQYLANSRYNDFVPVKREIRERYFDRNSNSVYSNAIVLMTHTGQYIIHGLYELDYIMHLQKREKAYGTYTFYPLIKFTNKLGITNICWEDTSKIHPRQYVYTTFFGALFIDFGWFAILFCFLFGCFYGLIATKANKSIFFRAIWVYLLVINVSLPVMSLIRGGGMYPFVCFLGILIFFRFINLKKNDEKSFSS
ncbi:hypothetical protein [Aquimarina sp. MMG016]|uniref:hypothetical protein n=1 Tax=Aquimarina sp. MMG016 TaxID=2822690 RepID=UPI001B3A359E|nr:hypothetical protein [Aquimarina sp. MMG016]MBQ4820089.1 hypothetical protein [Aquimarina sp. MMG016]